MPEQPAVRLEVATDRGPVEVRSLCPPEDIAGLVFEAGIGTFPRYRSLFRSPEGLAAAARRKEANVVLAVFEGQIVGYCACGYPENNSRWARLGPEAMYEFGVIEVSRNFRGQRLASRIVETIMRGNEWLEDKVTYIVGYSWHWDLEFAGISAVEYRQIFIRLLQPYGFKLYPTNEPNVALRPE